MQYYKPMSESRALPPFKRVAIGNLKFDPENPRLPRTVDGADEAKVVQWMLRDATLLELMGSISEQGYFEGEPLLVVPDQDNNYIVVEGNRRLAATKVLNDPTLAGQVRPTAVREVVAEARERPESLPVQVYDTRDEILEYLGFRHITGVKEWEPLAKARYLAELATRLRNEEVDEAALPRELAKIIGSRADYVRKLLNGLTIYNAIVDEVLAEDPSLSEEGLAFSVLTTALGYSTIGEYVGYKAKEAAGQVEYDLARLKDLTRWIHRPAGGQSVVGESRRLKDLARIVQEPEAVTLLKSGAPLAEALILAKHSIESFREGLRQIQSLLRTTFNIAPQVSRFEPEDEKLVHQIEGLSKALVSLVKAPLPEPREGDA